MSVRDEVYAYVRSHSGADIPTIRISTGRNENTIRDALNHGVRLGYFERIGKAAPFTFRVSGPMTAQDPLHVRRETTEDEKFALLALTNGPMSIAEMADHLDVPITEATKVLSTSLQRTRRWVVAKYELTDLGKRAVAELEQEASHAAE